MRALVLKDKGHLVMESCLNPKPGPGELLIRTKAATICTSDLNDIKYNAFGIRYPMIMGHEGAGIVAAVGKEVCGFREGDRVAVHPVMPCGHCFNCRNGLPHLCENMEHLGINRGGVFAEYFCIRADRARHIPDGMDFELASLMEPVCVCIEGINRANVKKGARCLIIGDGPFGIITARLLKAFEPEQIILSGRHRFRLQMAEGADLIYEKEVADVTAEILHRTKDEGVDSAILCVGTSQAVNTAIESLKPRGTLSVFSAIAGLAQINLFRVHIKELNICGSCNDENYLDQALRLLGDKDLRLDQLITHRLPFDHWQRAFELAEKGKDEALKVTMLF